jgi:hypothetical protein
MHYSGQMGIIPVDVDAPGVHLINHSCHPNCSMYRYYGHTLFYVLRNIEPHEELTISYHLPPSIGCTPCQHVCYCGSETCTGTMHDSEAAYQKWQQHVDLQDEKYPPIMVRVGDMLGLFDVPKSIAAQLSR